MIVDGEWDGVCACGKIEADGVKCRLGATHQTRPADKQDEPDIPSMEDMLA